MTPREKRIAKFQELGEKFSYDDVHIVYQTLTQEEQIQKSKEQNLKMKEAEKLKSEMKLFSSQKKDEIKTIDEQIKSLGEEVTSGEISIELKVQRTVDFGEGVSYVEHDGKIQNQRAISEKEYDLFQEQLEKRNSLFPDFEETSEDESVPE